MAKRLELEQTSFLYGGNSSFIEELYARYLADPGSVDPSWRAYFDELEPENRALFERARAALQPRPAPSPAGEPAAGGRLAAPAPASTRLRCEALIRDHLRVIMLIRAYRVRGHLTPSSTRSGLAHKEQHPELDYRTYGFTDADLDREFHLDYVLGPRDGDPAPDRGGPAEDLQRHGRHRVHAHPGPRAEGLDPVPRRGHRRRLLAPPPRTSARSSST